MASAGKGAALLADFGPMVETAEAAKEAAGGSPERKAAREATSLADYLTGTDTEENGILATFLTDLVGNLTGETADLFDKTDGQKMADAIGTLLALDEDYRPAGFDADKATDLLARWKGATGRRGNGGGSIPESQKVPCPIKVTFTYPEGSDVDLANEITHSSSWSSVSNEISKRARAIDGIDANAGYKRPESAATAWKAVRKAIIDGGEGGTVTVPTEHGEMIAEVTAVR